MKTILRIFSLSLLLGMIVSCGADYGKIDQNEYIGILPTPQIELLGQNYIPLNTHGLNLSVLFRNHSKNGNPVTEGIKILNKRLKVLGHPNIIVAEDLGGNSNLIIEQISEGELIEIFKGKGASVDISSKQLSQAYYIKVEGSKENDGQVSIKVSDDIGLYYAFVSVCQLIQSSGAGELIIPEIELADWPEIGLRLGKTSASDNSAAALNKFYSWMSLYKINQVGLQFHGEESRDLGRFRDNINQVCPKQEKLGLLETIVYFCPFRGNGYNFQMASDKQKYTELIHWVFDQGADGFEIDYNDWPDEQFGLPAEDVVTFAYNTIIDKKPDAYVLYCPPNRGPATYNKAASQELIRILENIPIEVIPIWTGMKSLLEYKLTHEDTQDWIDATGRKPFFWLNRTSLGADLSLARSVDGDPEKTTLPGGYSQKHRTPYELDGDTSKLVFPGERLPKELNRYFEGIHLNYPFGVQELYKTKKGYGFPIPETISSKELIYFATVADYIWNPHAWKGDESYKRAVKFIDVINPLMDGK